MNDDKITVWGSEPKTALEAELRKRFPTLRERWEFLDGLIEAKEEAIPANPQIPPYKNAQEFWTSSIANLRAGLEILENMDFEDTLSQDVATRVEESALGLPMSPPAATLKAIAEAEKQLRYLENDVRDLPRALSLIRKRAESL